MTYQCPVCGIEDENAYLRCQRPNCTDGRDRYNRINTDAPAFKPYYTEDESDAPLGPIPFVAGFLVGFVTGTIATIIIWSIIP